MNTKDRFLQAVQILAPGDQFIYKAAQRIPEEVLPIAPGGVALEFVVAMQTVRQAGQEQSFADQLPAAPKRLSLSHRLRIKSAEFWLKLGEADQALREIGCLPKSASSHPAALKAVVKALGALRERGEIEVQE